MIRTLKLEKYKKESEQDDRRKKATEWLKNKPETTEFLKSKNQHNLQTSDWKSSAMGEDIDFSYIEGTTIFGPETFEYKGLVGLENLGEQAWEDYLEDMNATGVNVEYNNAEDEFVVTGSPNEETGEYESDYVEKRIK